MLEDVGIEWPAVMVHETDFDGSFGASRDGVRAMGELSRAGVVASGKMFAETVEFEEWDNLIDDQR